MIGIIIICEAAVDEIMIYYYICSNFGNTKKKIKLDKNNGQNKCE